MFSIGTLVEHPAYGRGKVLAHDGKDYVVVFKAGDVQKIPTTVETLRAAESHGDGQLDLVRQAVRDVLVDHGWIDSDLEMGRRWMGGVVKLVPGKEGTQPKEVPIEAFFSKIVGIRDRLRVLEQKVNAHATLTAEEKVELQGYITRCYGSLTTFNALFASKESQFKGTGKEE